MSDILTSEQRHRCMSHIHSKNTKPEIIVRKYLFAHGYRYRINVKSLPGTPDIVLKKYRTVIFVNGCFWHGHVGCKYAQLPLKNQLFWEQKIKKNKERDLKDCIQLRDLGWHVILIWGCQLKPKKKEKTLAAIDTLLNSLFLDNRKAKRIINLS